LAPASACPQRAPTATPPAFVAEQPGRFRALHHLGEERLDHRMLEQSVSVLREHRVVPHRIVHRQSDEPPEQHVVADLLHQHPPGAHRIEHLQQQRPKQFLRRDRGSACAGVDLVEQPVQRTQAVVDERLDPAQRMIRRHELLKAREREQRFLHRIRTAHPRLARRLDMPQLPSPNGLGLRQ